LKKGRNDGLGWTAMTRFASSQTPSKMRLRNCRLAAGSASFSQKTEHAVAAAKTRLAEIEP
jgi:hypothetical protein